MTGKKLVLFCLLAATSPACASSFVVQSQSFADGARIPEKYVWSNSGCHGENISPQIEWRYAPIGTKGFAVTLHDADAPSGGWWHWALLNIPASESQLEEGASLNAVKLPEDVIEGKNDFGAHGYGGPCPPAGDKPHHYVITVYAMPLTHTDFTAASPDVKIGDYLRENALAVATMTAIYSR
jgi:Raf kinase inhibitor-like YbhB/YbcL family protein